LLFATTFFTLVAPLSAQVKQKGVWTDPQDETIPAVFRAQGEYVGEVDSGVKVGAQVIALDEQGSVQVIDGNFVYPSWADVLHELAYANEVFGIQD
jgi:hypothetical protein